MSPSRQGSGTYPKPRLFVFADFVLDVGTRTLLRNGATVHVEPKAFDVLATLLGSAGRVVTRQELLELHWGGSTVCGGAVGQCIWCIRKILGDNASAPRFIKTVARKGYRFVGSVRSTDDDLPDSRNDAPHLPPLAARKSS